MEVLTQEEKTPGMWAKKAEIDCSQTVGGLNTGGKCAAGHKYYFLVKVGDGVVGFTPPEVELVAKAPEWDDYDITEFGDCSPVEIVYIEGERYGRSIYKTPNIVGITIQITTKGLGEEGEDPLNISATAEIDLMVFGNWDLGFVLEIDGLTTGTQFL